MTPSGMEEVRVVNEKTGAEKGSKLARFDLIPAKPLWELAEHYGRGAEKYEDRNWERGYDWSLSIAALERHLNLFKQGEDIDPETQSKHIIAVAWHAIALAQFMDTHPELDDRYKPASPTAELTWQVGDRFTSSVGAEGQVYTVDRFTTYNHKAAVCGDDGGIHLFSEMTRVDE